MDLESHTDCELVTECTTGDDFRTVVRSCLCTTFTCFLLALWGTAGEADLDDPALDLGSAPSSSPSLARLSEFRCGVALVVDLRLCGVGKSCIESKVVEMAKRHSLSSVSRTMTMGRPGSVKRIKMARPIASAYVTVAWSTNSETYSIAWAN